MAFASRMPFGQFGEDHDPLFGDNFSSALATIEIPAPTPRGAKDDPRDAALL